MNRVRVKVCGITCQEDALMAIRCGADALGFNCWPGSKRYIDLGKETGWIAGLPSLVSRVAVMVNPSGEEARAVANMPCIDAIQLHGTESPEFCRALAGAGIQVIKAIPAKAGLLPRELSEYGTKQILLDSWKPEGFGGTGQEIDLQFAERFIQQHPDCNLIVAGGLTAENVQIVVERLHPYAVDVASGVEVLGNPRRKDPEKTRRFIENAVKTADILRKP